VEQFKYFGTTLTSQNSIQEEVKSRLKSGNACYHLVQRICSATYGGVSPLAHACFAGA